MSGSPPPTAHGAYSGVRKLGFACAATLLVIAALNMAIDPYGYFGTPVVPGLTARKPSAFTHDRFLKSGLASRSSADCLLAGNSRVGEGIPNQHPIFSGCRELLDISLAGPNMAETRESVALATRHRADADVIVNVDFFSFNALRAPSRGGSESTFASDPMSRARTMAAVTLSMDVTLDSVTTLARQKAKTFYELNGAVSQDYLLEAAQARPTRATFLRGLRGYILHMLPPPAYDFKVSTDASAPLEELRRFLVARQTAPGKTTLFISAPHAWQLELIDALGLWPEWERWKQSLVHLNEEVAVRAGRAPLPLWDFSGFNAYTTEEVPSGFVDTGPTPHYWDNSHFRHSLGRLILDRIADRDPPAGFGVRLDGNTLAQTLQDTRRARDQWRQAHPQDVEDVRSIVGCFAPYEAAQRLHLSRPAAETCKRLVALTR